MSEPTDSDREAVEELCEAMPSVAMHIDRSNLLDIIGHRTEQEGGEG